MPNWCYSDYAFTGNVDEITNFHDKLISLTFKERIPNGFGNSWLGNIVDGFGFNYNEIPCRGEVDYISDIGECCDENEFYITVHTAWEYKNEMWDKIIAKYYPSIKYMFRAEEPGSVIYVNTDIGGHIFPEKYIVYFNLPAKYSEDSVFYAANEKDIVSQFNAILGCRFKNYKQCKKRLYKRFNNKKQHDKGYFIKIHKYQETI